MRRILSAQTLTPAALTWPFANKADWLEFDVAPTALNPGDNRLEITFAQGPGTDGDEDSPSRRPPAPCSAGIYPHRNVGRNRPDLAAGQPGAAGAESGAGNGAVGSV
jgi:hypothetical protein